MDTEARCESHLLDNCPVCQASNEDLKHVYATEASKLVFHKTKKCGALTEGQRKIKRYGNTPSKIMVLTVQQAKRRGLAPCQSCLP